VGELFAAVGTAALWLAVLLSLCRAVNRRAGRPPWHPSALLAAFPLFYAGQIFTIKLLNTLGLLGAPSLGLALFAAGLAILAATPRIAPSPGALRFDDGQPSEAAADSKERLSAAAIATGCAALVLSALAAFALVAPTHIWDVQAYHMPMVASYVQNESLAPWPAQDLRQIYRVNGAELQMLWLAMPSRSEALVELPNLVALVVSLVAAVEIAHRVLGRRDLAYLAALAVLTAPQVLLGAVTAKNDLIFMALILCCFHWLIRDREERSDRIRPAVILAGLSGGLAIATKVMGINVLGAAGLTALVWWGLRRSGLRTPILLGCVGGAAAVLLVGDVYWQNFGRSPGLPIGTMPGEIQFRSGLSNLTGAAHFYLYDLPFRRLVTPQVFEHDFSHFGYVFPFAFVLGVIGAARAWLRSEQRDTPLGMLAFLTAVLFASVVAVRVPIQWDQRFMIWLVPVSAILALSLFRSAHPRAVVAAASFASALALSNVFVQVTNAEDALFVRSAKHLATTGRLASLHDVPPVDFPEKIAGFDRLARQADDGDSVLYVGAEDTWMYPAWGRRFRLNVHGVDGPRDAADRMKAGGHRFVVLEEAASAELRHAVLGAADESGYRRWVEAEGRLVLMRSQSDDAGAGS